MSAAQSPSIAAAAQSYQAAMSQTQSNGTDVVANGLDPGAGPGANDVEMRDETIGDHGAVCFSFSLPIYHLNLQLQKRY